MRIPSILIACLLISSFNTSAYPADPEDLVKQLQSGGHVLMIRHAYAPGSGDPAHFQVDDCSTQRNLNDQGRDQSRRIGQWLRSRGVDGVRVYSSQWCRCLETARLMAVGPVVPMTALNSFYERPQDREPNLTALRTFLSQQALDGGPIIMVTHFVTISAITGTGVTSGEGVLLKLEKNGQISVRGQLDFL